MKVIDIYAQYFSAECVFNERPRHAAAVVLTATSDEGLIRYEWQISFFPHDDEEDFAISYDAAASQTVYEGKGRRARKREAALLEARDDVCGALASSLNGRIFWDSPLREARLG